MRIISWNIHNRASLWEEVASLDADIALLQEAPKPPKSLSSKLNIVSNNLVNAFVKNKNSSFILVQVRLEKT